ncbi:MAG: lipocalin family protein [Treponema sp.]|nr:lipocalin family protein [Treponema sp.]
MKNTVKIAGIIALIAMIGLTVACGGGGGGGGKLSGTFEYEGSTRTFAGDKVTFQRDDYKSEGTFTVSGDELTITASDGDVTVFKFSLSGNTLTLENAAVAGRGYEQVWTKK